MKGLQSLAIASLVFLGSNAASAAPLDISVYSDPAGVLSFDHARVQSYQPVKGSELSFGLSDDVYWVKFEAPEIAQQSQVLYTCDTQLDRVDAYIPEGNNWRVVNTGANRAFGNRDLAYPCFVFDLTAASTPTVFMRIAATPFMSAAWGMVPKASYESIMEPQEKAYSIYFAFLACMFLLHAIFYLALRDVPHVLYLGYVASVGLLLATMSGHASMVLWPNATRWMDAAPVLFGVSTLTCALLLVKQLTEIERYSPWLSETIRRFVPLGLLVVFFVFIDETVAVALLGAYLVLVVLLVTCATVLSTYFRNQSAYILLGAIALMVPGGIIYYWRTVGWIDQSWLADNILYLTTTVDVVLLALALAYHNQFNWEARIESSELYSS